MWYPGVGVVFRGKCGIQGVGVVFSNRCVIQESVAFKDILHCIQIILIQFF